MLLVAVLFSQAKRPHKGSFQQPSLGEELRIKAA
jgi:hypothetical protein